MGTSNPKAIVQKAAVPGGGAAGQSLVKASGADGDFAWSTPAGGGDVVGPGGAVDGEVAVFNGATGKALKRLAATALPVSDAQRVAIDAKVQNSMAASTTVAPSASAVIAAIAAAGGGSGGLPTPIAATATVPFDNYTEMLPYQLTVDTVFVPNVGTAKQGGSANVDVVVTDATKRITFDSRFQQIGSTALDYTLNRVLSFSFAKTGTTYYWDVIVGRIVDVVPPTFGTPLIDNAGRNVIALPASEALGSFLGTTASVTLANAGGRTVSSVAISGSNLLITVSSAFAYGDTPSVAVAAGTVQDIAGNLAAASGVLAVTNGILPNARVDNMSLAGLAASDGGSAWQIFVGTPSKVGGHFTRPSGVRGVLTLESGGVQPNQLWTFNPGAVAAGAADFNQFCSRFTDLNNYVGIALDAQNSRVQAFAVVGGANVISAQVDGVLVNNSANNARTQFPTPNSFTVAINGTPIPGLTLDLTPWASTLTSTKLAYFMTELEPQQTVLLGLS